MGKKAGDQPGLAEQSELDGREFNIRHWSKFDRVPPECLKPIKGGRLNGKSDINPQWRLKAMTETFGPCGIGWKYEIVRLWTEAGANHTGQPRTASVRSVAPGCSNSEVQK